MTKDDLKTLATLPKLLSVMRKLSGEAMELQGLAATLGMMGTMNGRVTDPIQYRVAPMPAQGYAMAGPPQPQPHVNSEDTDPRAKPIPIQAPTNISAAQAARLAEQKDFLEMKNAEKEAALARIKNGG